MNKDASASVHFCHSGEVSCLIWKRGQAQDRQCLHEMQEFQDSSSKLCLNIFINFDFRICEFRSEVTIQLNLYLIFTHWSFSHIYQLLLFERGQLRHLCVFTIDFEEFKDITPMFLFLAWNILLGVAIMACGQDFIEKNFCQLMGIYIFTFVYLVIISVLILASNIFIQICFYVEKLLSKVFLYVYIAFVSFQKSWSLAFSYLYVFIYGFLIISGE